MTLASGQFLYNSVSRSLSFDGGTYHYNSQWRAFLAAQYASGTPVIVIYPLAEETTESVAPQPLHTSDGTNTASITAEVSPIALEAKYKKAAS